MANWRQRIEKKVNELKETNPKYAKVCLAIKSNNRLCKRKEVGFGRCKFHGGMTRTGMQNPNYRHGKCVTDKKALLEQIEKFTKDPNLKDLTRELATMKALFEATINTRENLLSERTYRQVSTIIRDIAHIIDVTKRVNEGYTLTIKGINTIIVQIVKVIQNRVKDPIIRRQIAGDIKSLSLMN